MQLYTQIFHFYLKKKKSCSKTELLKKYERSRFRGGKLKKELIPNIITHDSPNSNMNFNVMAKVIN